MVRARAVLTITSFQQKGGLMVSDSDIGVDAPRRNSPTHYALRTTQVTVIERH
jgi:hypothetical protein